MDKYILNDIEYLANEVMELEFSKLPELKERYKGSMLNKCLQDTKHSLLFLEKAISVDSLILYSDYIMWLGELLTSLKVPLKDLKLNLLSMDEVLTKKSGNSNYSKFIYFALNNLENLKVPTIINSQDNYSIFRKKYIEYILSGDRKSATSLVHDIYNKEKNLKVIYKEIFEKSFYDIGILWQTGKILISQEHYFTATTQIIMSSLYPYLFSSEKNGKIYIWACVSEELHEIGIRMVCDYLEMEGYDTYYVGSNVPLNDLKKLIKEKKADFLGLSTSSLLNIDKLKEYVYSIKNDPETSFVKIEVGGIPFNSDRELYKKVGADLSGGYAEDTVKSLNECEIING